MLAVSVTLLLITVTNGNVFSDVLGPEIPAKEGNFLKILKSLLQILQLKQNTCAKNQAMPFAILPCSTSMLETLAVLRLHVFHTHLEIQLRKTTSARSLEEYHQVENVG